MKRLYPMIAALLLVLAYFLYFERNPTFYYWTHKNRLQVFADDITKYQKLTSIELGYQGTYKDLNGNKVEYEDYHFINGDLVTRFKPRSVQNPAQIEYSVPHFLIMNEISPEKYYDFESRLETLHLRGFNFSSKTKQVNFHFKQLKSKGIAIDIIYSPTGKPEVSIHGDPGPFEIEPHWFSFEMPW